ncbi:DUF2200 domain-containing protein [Clostridium nigeriense]|uniref:DUF2200 domain-containing protein n=1 Tax=Clostridium nigeriense TaxID=1805470 RepID=UPI00082A3FC4|nr:DUF2200 domain-containing protein [Clostridium nigeriense]
MGNEKIYNMSFGKIYSLLVNKAIKKNRTIDEVKEIIHWLTGYTFEEIDKLESMEVTYSEFFQNAPELNPDRKLIKGTICGVKIENIEEPLMKEIRYLDKLIDELAKGKSMDKILKR